jgi:hypothetical protein
MLYGPIIFNVFHFLLLFLSIHRFYYLLSIPYLLQSSSNLLLPLSDGFHRYGSLFSLSSIFSTFSSFFDVFLLESHTPFLVFVQFLIFICLHDFSAQLFIWVSLNFWFFFLLLLCCESFPILTVYWLYSMPVLFLREKWEFLLRYILTLDFVGLVLFSGCKNIMKGFDF